MDPYTDEVSPEEEASIFFDKLAASNKIGFPFVGELRAVTIQVNLYDVQTGIYAAITVLFERSSAGYFTGSKIEILPFFVPSESNITEHDTLLMLRILGLVWIAVMTVNTLTKRDSFMAILTL